MKRPLVQYAETPEGKIAYQVVGDGPIDLFFSTNGAWNLDLIWEYPPLERFLNRLASFSRLILSNPRGFALSDPISLGAPPTTEEWTMDLRWVMDAAGSDAASFAAISEIALSVMLFAATFPERVSALAVFDAFAKLRQDDDYPWGIPKPRLEQIDQVIVEAWGSGRLISIAAPEKSDDEHFRDWFARLERGTVSPTTLSVMREMIAETDLRGVLPAIKAPTLVVSHVDNPYIGAENGRYLAEHIPNARYVERPGLGTIPWLQDADWTLDELQSFFTGTRSEAGSDDRVLSTLLFTDIVGSTERAAQLGDSGWKTLLDDHDTLARREVERFRGRPVKSTGDGMLATFDGPARAIRCALAMRESLRSIGIEIYGGLHTGEVEVRGEDVSGIAVSTAARVMAHAAPGEILVSGAVPPLVAGSGIGFESRGVHQLKGVPGDWELLLVKS